MRNSLTIFFLLNIITLSLTVNAELYKGLDEDGNIFYSDKPITNSKKFTPPSLTIVDAPKVKPKKQTIEDDDKNDPKEKALDKFKYKTFNITAPLDDEVIWNQPQLMVKLAIKPALNTADGHNIWLLMDNKPLVKNSKNLSLPIGRADRGSHTLQAQIKNKKGKVIKSTKTITVHIKHAVISKKPLQR